MQRVGIRLSWFWVRFECLLPAGVLGTGRMPMLCRSWRQLSGEHLNWPQNERL